MRIASIHLPSFPLQIHVRISPHLAGKAFAVTSGGERKTVLCCSRKAWTEGVRPQMTVTQARALSPDTVFINADTTLYRHALIALAETLLAHSVTVDIGDQYASSKTDDSNANSNVKAHASIYLRVPPKRRAQRYGEQLLAELHQGGYRARAGIADDRFTAWAAAVTGKASSLPVNESVHASIPASIPLFSQTTRVVARGGSAAYLAPLSLDLLPLTDSVRSMLSTLGVRSLGEFANLPSPTVGRRWMRGGVDFQKLARGLGPAELYGFTPTEVIVEHLHLSDEITELEPLSFMLRPLADRICKRLSGRGLAAAKIAMFLHGPSGRVGSDIDITELEIRPSRPTVSAQSIVDLARANLSEIRSSQNGSAKPTMHPICEIGLLVRETAEPEIEELDLFDYRDATAGSDAIDIAVARLRSIFGDDAVGAAELVDSYRPEATFQLTPFTPSLHGKPGKGRKSRGSKRRAQKRKTRRAKAGKAHRDSALPLVMNGTCGALRLIEPPAPQPQGLSAISLHGSSIVSDGDEVVSSRGPTRLEAEWWTGDPLERDYYEVETKGGGRYWVFRQKSDGQVYLHGIFD